MLLRCGQDENGKRRWFFQCFQECVEGRLRKHVYLIDDVDFVLPCLWWIADLFYQGTDVFYRIIGSSIEFIDIKGTMIVKASAGGAGIARFCICCNLVAIDCFCQDAGTSCFAYPSGATKQKSLCQVFIFDGIFECCSNVGLPHHMVKNSRAIFSGRNNKVLHERKANTLQER